MLSMPRALWLALTPTLLWACSDPLGPNPNRPDPEVFENTSAALSEAGIRAALRGGAAEIVLPVEKRSGSKLQGNLRVRLVDVSTSDERELSRSFVSFEQREARKEHTLTLGGIPPGIPRPETSAIVVDWSVETSAGVLKGKKSLYAALGSLEVQLRGATDIPEGGTTQLRAVARDARTLAPAAGAQITAQLLPEAEGGAVTELYSGLADDKGELAFDVSLPVGAEQGRLRISVGKDGSETWMTANVRVVRENAVQLSTDKTIYKPGQDLHLRALALHRTRRTPLADQAVVFEAFDAKGNKVFKRSTRSDSFGVASMIVPTDVEVNEGDWKVRVEVAGARSELTLPVVRYNLPKLKVEVTAEAELAKPGETLRGNVDARYLFGLPVANAAVNVVASREDGTALTSASGRTDAQGRYAYELTVPSGFSGASLEAIENGGAAVVITAEVVDTANQREAGNRRLPLVNGDLVVRAITEAEKLVPGVDNLVYVLVSDAIGRPIVADLTVSPGGQSLAAATDADGIAELHVMPAGETHELTVRAVDGAGRQQSRTFALLVDTAAGLLVRADRAIYAPGETAQISISAPASVARVYLDVYRGSEGVASQEVDVSGGRGTLSLPITEQLGGVLVFDAFALAGPGVVAAGHTRVLVDSADRLRVAMVANEQTYAPGANARVTVRVTDERGAPQVTALGLTAVDEAVFALGGERNDDPHLYFHLDPRALPADASVLGKSAADLYGSEARTQREKIARLLFASASGAARPGLDYNSVREEAPEVATLLTKKVRRDAINLIKAFIPLRASGRITEQTAPEMIVGGLNSTPDAFGRFYAASIHDQMWQTVTVRSAGPDETHGTLDDVVADVPYYWVFWANQEDIDPDAEWLNGGNRGGGVWDDVAFEGANGGQQPAPPADPNQKGGEASGEGARVRSDFRETVLVRPMLITDASGVASIDIPLADSITTWRIAAQASTRDGKLGAARTNLRTFQQFFVDFDVPTALTMEDEIEISAVVYNYLTETQVVNVQLEPAAWLSNLGSAVQNVSLAPSEVKSVRFRVRIEQAGTHELVLRANAGEIADALVRTARVTPNGTKEDVSVSDRLETAPAVHTIQIPADAIAGGNRVTLALTPGFAAQAVSGLEGMITEPHGCFEQTTSTAWPNTLVVTYLDTTGQVTPEAREALIAVVTRGYQRLLTFESPTGGFNWWGDADPGNRILTAIFLWHLKDLESLIEVDSAVRDRTLAWLVAQQQADGHFASGDALHSGNETLGTSEIRTTAFITWALAHTGWADDVVGRAATWLRLQNTGTDLYGTALAANALVMADPNGAATIDLFSRLDGMKEVKANGAVTWPTETESWTGAGGDVAAIETTGLVAYGLMRGRAYPENVAGAMSYLVGNKDAVGSWYNTQATMNALRALLAAASPMGSDADGTLTVRVNGQALEPIAVTPETGDVYRVFDFTSSVVAGDNQVELSFVGNGQVTYQLVRRAYLPTVGATPNAQLRLELQHDTSSPALGAPVTASVHATFLGQGRRDQVIVQVGRAPGFAPDTADLDQLVTSGKASRYEVNETHVTMYLMGLESGQPRDLSFRLTPTLSMTGEAPASRMYVYYEPQIRTELAPVHFDVR